MLYKTLEAVFDSSHASFSDDKIYKQCNTDDNQAFLKTQLNINNLV